MIIRPWQNQTRFCRGLFVFIHVSERNMDAPQAARLVSTPVEIKRKCLRELLNERTSHGIFSLHLSMFLKETWMPPILSAAGSLKGDFSHDHSIF